MKKYITNSPSLHSLKHSLSKNLLPQALQCSLSLSSPHLTDQIYALFLKLGHVLNPYLATSLITHFAKFGDFSRSLGFIFDIRFPDTVSFNALLSGYAQFGQSSGSFSLYNELVRFGLGPDRYTLSSLIKSCDSVEKVMIAHAICIKFGFNLSGFVASGLIQKYGKMGCVELAEKCFEECLDLDCVAWSAMINGFVWNNEFDKGKEVFMKMKCLGLEVNEFSLTGVLGALWDVREGELIHGLAVKMGLLVAGSIHLSNAMMNMYRRCRSRMDALKMFDEIPEPNVVSWTARIGVARDDVEAFGTFRFMHSNGLEVNELTLVNVLSSAEGPKVLIAGRQVHSFCQKTAFLRVLSVGNVLISMYGKCGQMGDARLVFDELVYRDSISWNSLIGGYSNNRMMDSALTMLSQMREFGIEPDKFTLASILGGVFDANFVTQVMQIHSHLVKTGFVLDSSMISCLISSYGKCSSVDNAKQVFSEINEPNVEHLQVTVASAVNAGCPDDALKLFNCARSLCCDMDGLLISIVLKACSALTNLVQGRAIHSLALRSGLENKSFVESAIVDFYCKCGSITDAEKAFSHISRDNLAAWNAMIMGYSQHGRCNEVLELFKQMKLLGIDPDEITYLGILNSCSHAGLVNEAAVHLNTMFELHGVSPCLEHYACLVDLLGRVGLLQEAKRTIDQMPMNPDAQVWQSLLSACTNWNDLDLGNVAARELLRLQPENDSAYVLLSSIYARAGNRDVVRRLRREMKAKFIHKEAGSSWIEIGGSIYYFLAEDTSNPGSEKIYLNLQTLAWQMQSLSETEDDCLAAMDC